MIIWEFFYSDTLWALMGAIKKWLGHTKRVPTTTSTGLISVIDKWNQEKFYFREKLTQKKIQSEKNPKKSEIFEEKYLFWKNVRILSLKNASFSCIVFACFLLHFGGQFIIKGNSQSASANLFNKLVIPFSCKKGCTWNKVSFSNWCCALIGLGGDPISINLKTFLRGIIFIQFVC